MSRESTIERTSCRKLRQAGALTVKLGQEGWPDQLIVCPDGRGFFIEFKQPRARHKLRADQELMRQQLTALGHLVLVVSAVLTDADAAALVQDGGIPC